MASRDTNLPPGVSEFNEQVNPPPKLHIQFREGYFRCDRYPFPAAVQQWVSELRQRGMQGWPC